MYMETITILKLHSLSWNWVWLAITVTILHLLTIHMFILMKKTSRERVKLPFHILYSRRLCGWSRVSSMLLLQCILYSSTGVFTTFSNTAVQRYKILMTFDLPPNICPSPCLFHVADLNHTLHQFRLMAFFTEFCKELISQRRNVLPLRSLRPVVKR